MVIAQSWREFFMRVTENQIVSLSRVKSGKNEICHKEFSALRVFLCADQRYIISFVFFSSLGFVLNFRLLYTFGETRDETSLNLLSHLIRCLKAKSRLNLLFWDSFRLLTLRQALELIKTVEVGFGFLIWNWQVETVCLWWSNESHGFGYSVNSTVQFISWG